MVYKVWADYLVLIALCWLSSPSCPRKVPSVFLSFLKGLGVIADGPCYTGALGTLVANWRKPRQDRIIYARGRTWSSHATCHICTLRNRLPFLTGWGTKSCSMIAHQLVVILSLYINANFAFHVFNLVCRDWALCDNYFRSILL